jgi:hypothetical protein
VPPHRYPRREQQSVAGKSREKRVMVSNRENLHIPKEEHERKNQQKNQHAVLDELLAQISTHWKSHSMNELFFCTNGAVGADKSSASIP